MKEKGYIKNCYFEIKSNDKKIFDPDGTPYLDGYAIIPLEKFKKLETQLGTGQDGDRPDQP